MAETSVLVVFGTLDKNIRVAVQDFMVKGAGARKVVEIKGGSHVVMISHPDAVVPSSKKP